MRRSGSRRHPLAQHGQLKRPRAWGQLLGIVGVCIATVAVAGATTGAWVAQDLASTFTDHTFVLDDAPAAPPGLSQFANEPANILIAGTDNCEPQYAPLFGDRCADAGNDGIRSDVLMLVHISAEPRRVTVLSFPRDMLVDIPECKKEDGSVQPAVDGQMINSAFERGGVNCSAKTITALTGLPIAYAASVNWGGVIEITNAIGGVDVCLATAMQDDDSTIDLQPGTHTLQGPQALAFLRARYSTIDGSDLARIGNQQQYLSSLVRKITSEQVLSDPAKLLRLAHAGLAAIDPSTSLTNPLTLVQMGLAIKNTPTKEYAFIRYPVFPAPQDPNRLVPDEDSATQVLTALQENRTFTFTAADQGQTSPQSDAPVDPAAVGSDSEAPPAQTPAPADAVVLPEQVQGNSADTATCTSGRVY